VGRRVERRGLPPWAEFVVGGLRLDVLGSSGKQGGYRRSGCILLNDV
jgi:hypothetical protein